MRFIIQGKRTRAEYFDLQLAQSTHDVFFDSEYYIIQIQ